MQLTSTTDYAIRIVCYLAAQRQMISTSELSQELSVPSSYIPKITKKLKQAGIIKACEGTNGGYMLAKQPENISLMEIISCVEETMAINRCLEEDRFCSRNLENTCKIHKILLSLQNTYNNKLESVKVSDVIRPGEDEYFGRFYVVLKLNLKEKSYECVYSHIREVYEKVRKTKSYGTPPKRWRSNGIPSLQGGGCLPSPERYRPTSTPPLSGISAISSLFPKECAWILPSMTKGTETLTLMSC